MPHPPIRRPLQIRRLPEDDDEELYMYTSDEAMSSCSSSSSLDRLLYVDETTSERPLIPRGHLSKPFVFSATKGRDYEHPQAVLRKKMLQQRERALQQKRSRLCQNVTSSMVMPTENFAIEAAGSAPSLQLQLRPGYPERRDCGTALDHLDQLEPLEQARSKARSLGMPLTLPMLQEMANLRNSPMALCDKDMSSIIVPDHLGADIKEEEARRRGFLEQELDERGICPVYDPSPLSGIRIEPNFDFWNIAQDEIKSFLLQPAPKHAGMIECRIVRDRVGATKFYPKYTMESDGGVFLLNAKKQKHNRTSNYTITMSEEDFSKDGEAFLGKLRSSLLGLQFTSYDKGLNPKKIDSSMPEVHALELARQELVNVQYSSSLWGSKPRGPRKMSVVIPHVLPNGQRVTCRSLTPERDSLYSLHKSGTSNHLIDCFENKPPKWNEQIGAYVLNFNRRVTQASVKNFQLMSREDPDTVFLQFGRVGKDIFNMDFRYPFSPFQAFAICLSSFDYKLCCE